MDQSSTTQPTKTILLVEDDLFVRDLYVRTLEKSNYNVVTAVDGQEGIDKSKSAGPDLILLDIMLPKVNGIDVLRSIKAEKNTKSIPVFLLTNLGQEGIIREAFNIGASGYFLKARLLPQEVVDHVGKFFETGVVPEASKEI